MSTPTAQDLYPASGEIVRCDVAIIGSGMGGSTFAYGLRKSGLDVVVVERGDRLPREIENWSPEAVFAEQRYANAEPWLDGEGAPFSPGVFYYVGGNTKLYGAMLPRFRETDFGVVEHAEGVSPPWPISYADLEPWYCKAETLYAVHGQQGADPTDPWRSCDYPYPALSHDPALLPLERYLRKCGLKPFSMPAAVDYRSGGACVLCSTCDGFPCLVNAKADAEQAALNPAMRERRVRLLARTKIEQLQADAHGKRVTRAVGVRDGEPIIIEADRFVLACGAVNTAVLLLRSANAQHPNGLGNSSDKLGRNYMVHNSTFMLAVDPRRENKVTFQKTLALNDWYLAGPGNWVPWGNIQMLGKLREPMLRRTAPWLPRSILTYLTDHSVDLYLTTEDLPSAENRVVYDPARSAIRVHWRPNNVGPHKALVKATKKLMRGAGYPLIFALRMGIATNSHQCGTAVMGVDPSESVVAPDCKLHDLQNVWIVDSSVFPSSAAVNPALTIAANALRVANLFQADGPAALVSSKPAVRATYTAVAENSIGGHDGVDRQ